MAKVHFHKLIKDLTETGGMTQTEVAASVGVSVATICQMKHGRVENPKYSVALKIIDLHRRKVLAKRAAA